MDRISDLAELAASTRAPLAGGETLGGLGQLRELIQIGRIGTPIIDVTWGGGLTFAKKVATVAEAFAKPVAFHDCSGPVTLAVSTHLAMACPKALAHIRSRMPSQRVTSAGSRSRHRPPTRRSRKTPSVRRLHQCLGLDCP